MVRACLYAITRTLAAVGGSFAVVALMIGCASAPKTAEQQTNSDANSRPVAGEKTESAFAWSDVVSFHSTGSLISKIAGKPNPTVTVALHSFKTDSLIVSMQGFGLILGKLQSTPEKLVMYETTSNTAYEGSPTRENFLSTLNIPLDHKELILLSRGHLPIAESEYSYREQKGDSLILQRIDGNVSEQVILRVADKSMISCIRKIGGEFVMLAQYDDFRTLQGLTLPYKVALRFPKADVVMEIAYSSIEFNKQNTRYSFAIPGGAVRQKL